MILIDFSSIVHRMVFTSSNEAKSPLQNGKFVTAEFIDFAKHLILQELFSIKRLHSAKFGELILCIDNKSTGYWREDVYKQYKSNRKATRDETPINYKEVFEHINELTDYIENYLPIKVVSVPRAEADDIMLVLAREYHQYENILIHSPDKDMIQAQRDNESVYQYSALTKKWLVPENKYENMDHWIREHVCLGDASDGVPKVIDHTEFSPNFIQHLITHNIDDHFHHVHHFKYGVKEDNTIIHELQTHEKVEVLQKFEILDRKTHV